MLQKIRLLAEKAKQLFRPGVAIKHTQSGVILLTAVLILASVVAISFTVSALALREIRASRQLVYSEPAIISAEAGAETALFFRMRKLAPLNSSCPTVTTETLPQGSNFKVCTEYYDNPYIFGTEATNNEVVVFYDPLNPTSPSSGYTSVAITATSSTEFVNQMLLEIYDLDDPAAGPIIPKPIVTVGGPTENVMLDPAKSYAFFLVPGSPGSVSGYIRAYAGAVSLGAPAKNPRIISTGSRASLLRKLQILLKR